MGRTYRKLNAGAVARASVGSRVESIPWDQRQRRATAAREEAGHSEAATRIRSMLGRVVSLLHWSIAGDHTSIR